MKRAVFLDRDGVLNEPLVRNDRFYGPTTLDEFHLFEETPHQIRRLKKAGFLCILFTNQPDIARGRLSQSVLDMMHTTLKSQVPLDDIFVCLHDDSDHCACRKPKPGMILEAAKKWDIDLKKSFAVGDRWRDIDAGHAVGCQTILIKYPYSDCQNADYTVMTLSEAVSAILKTEPKGVS